VTAARAAAARGPLGALVLAAGLGTRLRPYTDDRPKCLVEVGGSSIAARTVEALAAAGVAHTVFVVGHRAGQVRRAIGGRSDAMTVGYIENARYATTGTATSTALGLARLAGYPGLGRVCVVEGDVVFDPRLLRLLLDHPAENVTLVEPWRPEIDGSTVGVAPDGRVLTWTHPGTRPARFRAWEQWKLVNLHVLTADAAFGPVRAAAAGPGYPEAPAGADGRSLESALAAAGVPVHAVLTRGLAWVEIDDADDLARAAELFAPG
jgi:choline kinase